MVWRVDAQGGVCSHTGMPQAPVQDCWMDDEGRVYLRCAGVLGVVHSQDMVHVADVVEQGHWHPQPLAWDALPQRFQFVRSPQRAAAQA